MSTSTLKRGGRTKHLEPEPAASTLRCAVYTRKSTSEGLDQDFNSLDAQREACEAYVASQRSEGWTCLPDRYDDGGFTGGNMERPAFKRLMADVETGLIDCIVVYKVDRLSRSLMDFARIIEVLDRRQASFVSITQQFNTTTSMGRLTLNILLSFAQFEREIISERTRDKMSAARRKGKWVGGVPILGYDVDPNGRRLLVNKDEAVRVRRIFKVYLEEQSLIAAVRKINQRGWGMKLWTTKKGVERGGSAFNKNNLHNLLTNLTYLGKVAYKGEVYEGEHDAIIDEDVWQRTQGLLGRNRRNGGKEVRNKYGALLKGLLSCRSCRTAMTHSYTVKGNRRYRYYVCTRAQKQGWDSCPTKSLPAGEIEDFVVERIRCVGGDPAVVAATLGQAGSQVKNRLGDLEREKGILARELERHNAQIRRLIDRTARNGEQETPANARLADLQDRIRTAEQRATEVEDEIIGLRRQVVDEEELAAALSLFNPVWESLSPKEKARIVQLLVESVMYDGENGKVSLTFRPSGIKALAREARAPEKGMSR